MKSREFDYTTEAVADFLRELVRLRSCGLVPEIQPFVTAAELESGHLARAVRTYLLDAVRWGQDNAREPPPDYCTPLREPTTAPPPAGWDDEITPLLEGYPVEMQDADTTPQTPRAKHRADVLSSRLKRRT